MDTDQNALFYFWLIPGLTFSTYYPFDIFVEWVYPLMFVKFIIDPYQFIEEEYYLETGIAMPKPGLPKMVS